MGYPMGIEHVAEFADNPGIKINEDSFIDDEGMARITTTSQRRNTMGVSCSFTAGSLRLEKVVSSVEKQFSPANAKDSM